MSRRLLGVVIAALLVLTAHGGAGAAAGTAKSITIAGRLEYVVNLSAPHYEVAGYALIYSDNKLLATLRDKDVIVTGTESGAPSIIMKRTLAVSQITAKSPDTGVITIPVMPAPEPVTPPSGSDKVTIPAIPPSHENPPGGGDKVTIPAIPPSHENPPDGGDKVTIPAIPPGNGRVVLKPIPAVPFHNTAYHILFGKLIVGTDRRYYLTRPGDDSEKISVSSSTIDLRPLVGKKVALVVSKLVRPNGQVEYVVRSALNLSGDLGVLLANDTGIIYTATTAPITVRWRGRAVAMDQAPILGNGRTLVALRAIGEALGARVQWDADTQTATVALGDRTVTVTAGSGEVVVLQGTHQHTVEADVTPVVVNGRTMVPVRVLVESLGLQVEWNEATQTVELD
jgi:hypothetical protein